MHHLTAEAPFLKDFLAVLVKKQTKLFHQVVSGDWRTHRLTVGTFSGGYFLGNLWGGSPNVTTKVYRFSTQPTLRTRVSSGASC